MKMFIFVFLSAILIVNAAYSKFVAPKPRPLVYGGYTQCIVYNYSYYKGQLDSSSKWESKLVTYTENGDILKSIDFNKDNSINTLLKKEYDDKGNLISEIYYHVGYNFAYK